MLKIKWNHRNLQALHLVGHRFQWFSIFDHFTEGFRKVNRRNARARQDGFNIIRTPLFSEKCDQSRGVKNDLSHDLPTLPRHAGP